MVIVIFTTPRGLRFFLYADVDCITTDANGEQSQDIGDNKQPMGRAKIREKPTHQGNSHGNHDAEPEFQVSNLFLGEIEFRYVYGEYYCNPHEMRCGVAPIEIGFCLETAWTCGQVSLGDLHLQLDLSN